MKFSDEKTFRTQNNKRLLCPALWLRLHSEKQSYSQTKMTKWFPSFSYNQMQWVCGFCVHLSLQANGYLRFVL